MKKVIALFILSLMALSITACGDSQSPSSTVSPSPTPTTPNSQSPSVEPSVPSLTVEEYIETFKSAGLPVDNVIIYTEETDVNKLLGRPNQYTSKVSFADTRLEQYDAESPNGGTIEIFETVEDAIVRKDYLEAVNYRVQAASGQYMYLNGKALLRLEYDLTPKQAAEYAKLFMSPGAVLPSDSFEPSISPTPSTSNDADSDTPETQDNDPEITLEEFNALTNGMTYNEVVEIIGGEGTLMSSSMISNIKTEMYSWDGSGSLGANANAMFQNGSLISKAQSGLE